MFELAIALDAYQDGAHLVALGEHQFVDRAGVELGEKSWQLAQIARAAANRRRILTHGPEISYGDEFLRASALSRSRRELARAIRRGLEVAGEDEVLDALLTSDRELDRPDALALIDNAQRQSALIRRTQGARANA